MPSSVFLRTYLMLHLLLGIVDIKRGREKKSEHGPYPYDTIFLKKRKEIEK